jgi:hypothetical protein
VTSSEKYAVLISILAGKHGKDPREGQAGEFLIMAEGQALTIAITARLVPAGLLSLIA